MIIFNELSEEIVREEHICYYTNSDVFDKIELFEVIKLTLKHPSAPEHAFIQKFETKIIKEFNRYQNEAASVILLEAAQKNVRRNYEINQ
jgi:hypothetical protein